MPKIGNWASSSDMPCDRCGSKRRVSKAWTERIKHEHSEGFMIIYHTQLICTNKECQSALEKTIIDDNKKREKLRLARTENAAKRLAQKPTV